MPLMTQTYWDEYARLSFLKIKGKDVSDTDSQFANNPGLTQGHKKGVVLLKHLAPKRKEKTLNQTTLSLDFKNRNHSGI